MKRGAPPLGGGEVVFTCPITKVALLVSGGHDVIRIFFSGRNVALNRRGPKKHLKKEVILAYMMKTISGIWTSKCIQMLKH